MTIWTVQLPDAKKGSTSSFLFKIDEVFKFLIDDTHRLIIQSGSQSGYTVVWTEQNLGQ